MKVDSYTPVGYDFKELVQELAGTGKSGKVFYFCQEEFICEHIGRLVALEDALHEGEFVVCDGGKKIRLDKIITVFGKPGPAYDEYDRYGSSCMDCTAGFEKDDTRLEGL